MSQRSGVSALQWATPDERKRVCRAFCDHIAAGYSIDSFPDADHRTLRNYAEQFPEDFPPEELQAATRRGLLEWERIGKAGSQGELAKFNASAWAFNMKNRAGWRDRTEPENWTTPGVLEESHRLEALKPRSAAEIALGVMALLTAKDLPSDDDCP